MLRRQCTRNLPHPALRARASIGRKRRDIGHSVQFFKQLRAAAPQFSVHNDVQRRLCEMRKVFRTHVNAKNCIHHIARRLKQTHELARIVPAVVVGIRHPNQIDRMCLYFTPLRAQRL